MICCDEQKAVKYKSINNQKVYYDANDIEFGEFSPTITVK